MQVQSRLPLTMRLKASEAARQVTASVWPYSRPDSSKVLGRVEKTTEDEGVEELVEGEKGFPCSLEPALRSWNGEENEPVNRMDSIHGRHTNQLS